LSIIFSAWWIEDNTAEKNFVKIPKKVFTYDVFYVIIEVFVGSSHVGTERKERKMA
jgi:hypothetical protein